MLFVYIYNTVRFYFLPFLKYLSPHIRTCITTESRPLSVLILLVTILDIDVRYQRYYSNYVTHCAGGWAHSSYLLLYIIIFYIHDVGTLIIILLYIITYYYYYYIIIIICL